MARRFWAGAVVIALLWICAWPAAAEPATITVQTPSVTLTVADSGDGTGTVTATNLTDAQIAIQLAIENPPQGCAISPTQDQIPAQTQHDTAITVTGCRLTSGSAITIDVKPPTGNVIAIQAKVATQASPDWSIMTWSFFGTLIGAFVICLIVLVVAKSSLGQGLPGLGNDYDISKSWATTATLIASAFAGIFGSTDVLKDVLGKDDASITALVGVSAAIALGFVTAAPLILGALKNDKGEVIVAGLLAGALLTLAGTGGQLLVLVRVGHQLDLGKTLGVKTSTIVLWLGILGVAMLAAYAVRSLDTAIEQGKVAPTKTTTTVKPKRRKTHKEIADQVQMLRGLDDADLHQAIDQLHQEEDDQAYEIAVTAPSRPRTAIL